MSWLDDSEKTKKYLNDISKQYAEEIKNRELKFNQTIVKCKSVVDRINNISTVKIVVKCHGETYNSTVIEEESTRLLLKKERMIWIHPQEDDNQYEIKAIEKIYRVELFDHTDIEEIIYGSSAFQNTRYIKTNTYADRKFNISQVRGISENDWINIFGWLVDRVDLRQTMLL